MRAYEEQKQRKLLGDNVEPEVPDIKMQGLGLKPRRPSIREMIGDNNPLSDEEFEELNQLFKFGRVSE
jgi:hypothetical protein